MTIKEALQKARDILKSPIYPNDKSTAIQDARILFLSVCTHLKLEDLFLHAEQTLRKEDEEKYFEFVNMRANGMSVSAIVGLKNFCGFDFYTNKDVLIPRPETEILVSLASDYAKSLNKKINMLDICTGTGCIGLSVAKISECVDKLTLSDISPSACNMAKKNANNLCVDAKIINSDLFDKIPDEKYDIITANPPYISKSEYSSLSIEVKNEPEIALISDDDGYFHIKKIITQAKTRLACNSALLIEIGEDQGAKTLSFAKEIYPSSSCEIIKDLSYKDRFLQIINIS